jgi:acetyltransferase
VRAAGPGDRKAVERFVAHLSPASRYLRFLRAVRQLPQPLMDALLRFEPAVRATLLAFPIGAPAELIGLAQYESGARPDECEVAVVVADPWQRRGVASRMLCQLAAVARSGGFSVACAEILSDNHAAIELARRLGCAGSVVPGIPQMTRVRVALAAVGTPPWMAAHEAAASTATTGGWALPERCR